MEKGHDENRTHTVGGFPKIGIYLYFFFGGLKLFIEFSKNTERSINTFPWLNGKVLIENVLFYFGERHVHKASNNTEKSDFQKVEFLIFSVQAAKNARPTYRHSYRRGPRSRCRIRSRHRWPTAMHYSRGLATPERRTPSQVRHHRDLHDRAQRLPSGLREPHMRVKPTAHTLRHLRRAQRQTAVRHDTQLPARCATQVAAAAGYPPLVPPPTRTLAPKK